MNIKHPFIAEILTVIALVVAPFVLPHLGFSLTTVNRILIWGLFGLGFDLLFGYIGLLSFGQSHRSQTHRHLFRHDYSGDRGGVLLRRVQSIVRLHWRRERLARRADAK